MAVFLNDTFTDTAGTPLASHTGETGATWTLHPTTSGVPVISDANRLRPANATVGVHSASGTASTEDYQVAARIRCVSKTAEFNGPVIRLDAAARTCYVVAYLNATNQWGLYEVVAGTSTNRALTSNVSASMTVGESYDVTVRTILASAGTVRIDVFIQRVSDGFWCTPTHTYQAGKTVALTYTDTTPRTGPALCGAWMQGTAGSGNAAGFHIDAITAADEINPPLPDYATISADGLTIDITFTVPYGSPLLPATGVTGFTVSPSGVAVTVTGAARASADTIRLTLSRPIYAYERPTITYAPGNLADSTGNTVDAFTFTAVVNGSTLVPDAGESEVVLLGTPNGDAGTSGNELANAFDGVVTNYFEAAGAEPHYAGLDAGTAVVLRRVRLTPRGGDGTTDFEERLKGAKVQGSNTSSSTGFVDLYAVPSTEPYYLPRFWRNEIPLYTNETAYRYFRLLEATSNQAFLAEIEFVTDAGPTSSKPVAPTMSPMGGRFPDGSTTVTLTSRTSTASIYYTTNGDTPDNTDTLYAGPFTLDFSGGEITLKAVAYDAALSTTTSDVSSGIFSPWGFTPAEDLYDDRGNLIEAHDGHVLYDEGAGRYYWYGAFANKANVTGGNPDTIGNKGVWCYSSADLYNWRLEGHILGNAGWKWVERPHVVYNDSTEKYVLWAHMSNDHSANDRAGIAIADAPQGPWRWVSTAYDPNGFGIKDCNLFVDDDGTGYLVYNTHGTHDHLVARLSADYLTTDGTTALAGDGTTREAPVLFKRGETYFLLTSGSNYYDATNSFNLRYQTNTGASPVAAWVDYATANTLLDNPDPVGSDFNGQPTCVFRVPGKVDGYVLLTDHFNATALHDSRYVFRPLTFPTDTTMAAAQPAEWDLSTFTDAPPSSTHAVAAMGLRIGIGL